MSFLPLVSNIWHIWPGFGYPTSVASLDTSYKSSTILHRQINFFMSKFQYHDVLLIRKLEKLLAFVQK